MIVENRGVEKATAEEAAADVAVTVSFKGETAELRGRAALVVVNNEGCNDSLTAGAVSATRLADIHATASDALFDAAKESGIADQFVLAVALGAAAMGGDDEDHE